VITAVQTSILVKSTRIDLLGGTDVVSKPSVTKSASQELQLHPLADKVTIKQSSSISAF